jgi:hypothetical protein
MSNCNINVPVTFQNPLFYTDGNFTFDDTLSLKHRMLMPFFMDLLVREGEMKSIDVLTDSSIRHLFHSWEAEKMDISDVFKLRNRPIARPKMIRSISWFITSLFWINGKHVERLTHLVEDCSNLLIQPVNLKERLSYILQVPDHYHAFIQLSELFAELEKKWHTQLRKKQHMDMN